MRFPKILFKLLPPCLIWIYRRNAVRTPYHPLSCSCQREPGVVNAPQWTLLLLLRAGAGRGGSLHGGAARLGPGDPGELPGGSRGRSLRRRQLPHGRGAWALLAAQAAGVAEQRWPPMAPSGRVGGAALLALVVGRALGGRRAAGIGFAVALATAAAGTRRRGALSAALALGGAPRLRLCRRPLPRQTLHHASKNSSIMSGKWQP